MIPSCGQARSSDFRSNPQRENCIFVSASTGRLVLRVFLSRNSEREPDLDEPTEHWTQATDTRIIMAKMTLLFFPLLSKKIQTFALVSCTFPYWGISHSHDRTDFWPLRASRGFNALHKGNWMAIIVMRVESLSHPVYTLQSSHPSPRLEQTTLYWVLAG